MMYSILKFHKNFNMFLNEFEFLNDFIFEDKYKYEYRTRIITMNMIKNINNRN